MSVSGMRSMPVGSSPFGGSKSLFFLKKENPREKKDEGKGWKFRPLAYSLIKAARAGGRNT